MPYAILFQLCKKFSSALLVEVLDPGPAAGCDNLEFLGMNLEKPWHKRASLAFKMPKHTDFVGKALIGLRPTEGLVDPPIVADAHLCPQRVLDLVHAGANMAHQQDQASSEAALSQQAFQIAKGLRRQIASLVFPGA